MPIMSSNTDILCWNVRGLNAAARCLTVHEMIRATPCQLVCLQETKLQHVDHALATFLGGNRFDSFTYKPAQGTRGGILILWNDSTIQVTDEAIGRYSITVTVTERRNASAFKLTAVYGPSRRAERPSFLQHLRSLKPDDDAKWLVLGDFNLIYRARDKNNNHLNLAMMRRFRNTLAHCELHEIRLQNRKYTWSNLRQNPTLVRLDRVFCNVSWDLHFAGHALHALSSGHSDHCPLLLSHQSGPRRPAPFRFENYWTKLPRFMDVVKEAWSKPTSHTEPFHRLGHKLHHTATALKAWARTLIPDARLKFHMAQEVILRLDEAEDLRPLSTDEFTLRQRLKKRVLGWAVIEKARRKQCARINYIREGDANTKFFHLRANARRRKNLIQRLRYGQGWVTSHDEKGRLIQTHFENMMQQPPPRTKDLDWDSLWQPTVDLSNLDDPFTEEEILAAINDIPHDKAPGPDGFTGLFYKTCWPIIRQDIICAINSIYNLRCRDFNLLNKANIVLIPKKDGPEGIADYRPISLIHGFAKLVSKLLAARLAPHLNQLISPCQSAFIKGRSIHDNFMYVRNLARRLHRNKTPTLFLKLDISKAFDSVRWDYLLTLLQKRGFPPKWCSWLAATLASSTSRVLLNGCPLDPIAHRRGLRQGDPLSPLLFILAIDPLHSLLAEATDRGLLSKVSNRNVRFRASMYADDAAIFLKPTTKDVRNMQQLLLFFGDATGLCTNLQKTSVTPIACNNIDIETILGGLPVKRVGFPIKYLGLPLTVKRLKRIHFQPLVDKAAGRLSAWNGRNLNLAGRTCLVKAVLSSQPVFLLTALKPPDEVIEDLDKLRRRFLWAGHGALTGGKCKVNWTRSCLPKENGGLGILDLRRFARALRLRWLWHSWVSPDKTWAGTKPPCDDTDRLLFATCTTIKVGNGRKTSFWEDAWVQGRRPKDIAPLLYTKSRRKNRYVDDALTNNNWIQDLNHRVGFTVNHFLQYATLRWQISQIERDESQDDHIIWNLTADGQYTASSAYRAQFIGCTRNPRLNAIWKAWAPPKCKIFTWLILQNRVWTSDRLAKRNWDHSDACLLCRQTMETALHLLSDCRYTRQIWILVAEWVGQAGLRPQNWNRPTTTEEWWDTISRIEGIPPKTTRSLAMLIVWEIWKERNARVFDRKEMSTQALLAKIKGEAHAWLWAGARPLEFLLSRE